MQFNIADLFELVCDTQPDLPAVIDDDHTTFSFRDLDNAANQHAHQLITLGCTAKDHVGIALENSFTYLALTLAICKIGATPVTVNYHYTTDEMTYVANEAQLNFLFVSPTLHQRWTSTDSHHHTSPNLHFIITPDDTHITPSADPISRPPATARSAESTYIIFTGGTTGYPKAVVWTHRDLFFAALGGGNPGGEPITDPT